MKNHFVNSMLGAICLSIISLSFNYKKACFKTSIVISETPACYRMAASYDEDRTQKVILYMDECMRPDLVFKNKEQFDEKLILKDKTTFYFQFSPGSMKINLLKDENSIASLIKIKKMCAGLNDVLNR